MGTGGSKTISPQQGDNDSIHGTGSSGRDPNAPDVQKAIRGTAWRISRHVADGDALRPELEEVLLLAAYRASDQFDPSRGSYLGWIRGALELQRRRICESLKSRAGRWARFIWIDDPNCDSADILDMRNAGGDVWALATKIDVRDFRDTLRGTSRMIFDLLVLGFSPSFIARELGISKSTFFVGAWKRFVTHARGFFDYDS